ncbi:hypothetical protein B296_00034145 [Ensete ventricosum]|uniref:Uncharacterized protein n=1 Tax=Ensete ventricosum TaxID=4639 RepID=A0A427A0T6_ENSVE|nr:hypothetical protein B296_00034145 [Ensete ventricosum]
MCSVSAHKPATQTRFCQVDRLRNNSTHRIHIVAEELVQAYSKGLLSHPLLQKHLLVAAFVLFPVVIMEEFLEDSGFELTRKFPELQIPVMENSNLESMCYPQQNCLSHQPEFSMSSVDNLPTGLATPVSHAMVSAGQQSHGDKKMKLLSMEIAAAATFSDNSWVGTPQAMELIRGFISLTEEVARRV